MSTSPIFPNMSSAALAQRAVPPYAGPRYAPGEALSTGKVGPFVPAESRASVWTAPDEPAVAVAVAPLTPVSATPVSATPVSATPVSATPLSVTALSVTPVPPARAMPTPVAASAIAEPPAEMVIPSSIPPYRPLRPTPIVTPAIRTPLYIPPIPTPAGEPAVEDEGLIEPQLLHTSEFEVPAAPVSEAGVSDLSAAVGPAAEAPATEAELPWIDSFLASTPPMAMDAVAEIGEAAETSVRDASAIDASADEAPADEAVADEWPLDEAAAEFRALRSAMDEVAAHEQGAADDAGEGDDGLADLSAIAPLPVWSDDDLMDIMPIRHSGKTPLSNAAIPADGELWAERARKAHEEAQVFRAMASAQAEREETGVPENAADASDLAAPSATAEEAAHALELLARRVRAGELTLPSYDPRMGEPAALVAALAALLGVRLR